MIKPTVGRVVWFTPSFLDGASDFVIHDRTKPLAAIVAHVWSDALVNLAVFDSNGTAHKCTSVPLVQANEPEPNGYFCAWMPYQVGQAAKTAEVEAKASAVVPTVASIKIARVCHEVNRAYCASIGDDSQPAWADAPAWQRDSAIAGVNFTLANPDAKPSDSHVSWLAEKEAAGWKYGPVKNPDAKEHPCFVPYDQLPVEQRTKDYLFQAVVRALA